jgi:hypothetical protein
MRSAKTSLLPILASMVVLAAPLAAHGQAPPPPFIVQLVARLDRLAPDSAVHARTGAANGMALFASVPPDAIGRVSDADLVRLIRLLHAGFSAVDAPTCAMAYGQRGTDGLPQAFIAMASKLDSVQAFPWVNAFVPLFEAGIAKRPIGTRVSDAEARQALQQAFGALTGEDRARLQRGATRTGTAEDICFFVRTTYASLLALPEPRAAAVLRTMMFGSGT